MTWAVLLLQAAASALVGATILVVVRYLIRWNKNGRKGHLPLHIWLVAVSYDFLLLGVVIQTMVLVRWWHWLVYVPAILFGAPAMYVLSRPAKDRSHD